MHFNSVQMLITEMNQLIDVLLKTLKMTVVQAPTSEENYESSYSLENRNQLFYKLTKLMPKALQTTSKTLIRHK